MIIPSLLIATALSAAPSATSILVTDLKVTSDVSPDVGSVIGRIVTARLSKYPGAEVLSGADIRQMIELEAEKQAAGCDDASCLSEVAGALGAEIIVTGQVGRLGESYIISLSVIDVGAATAVARETAELDSIEDAPGVVRPMVDRLMERMEDRVGRPENEVTFLDVVSGTLTWTGYGLFGTGLLTLAGQMLVFGIAGGAQPPGSYETAWMPVCGPFGTFLVADPNTPLSDLAFACCACETLSCCAIIGGGPLAATGLLVDLIPEEEQEAAAQAAFAAPPPPAPIAGLPTAVAY